MALPSGPNPGSGLPQRPGGGLPVRPAGGGPVLPPKLPQPQPQQPAQPPTNSQQAANEALRAAIVGASGPAAEEVIQNERLSQYDFDAQRPLVEELATSVEELAGPAPDVDEERRLAEARDRRERETSQRFEKSMESKKPAGKVKNNVVKPQAGELDKKGQNVFVDKNEKKLKPFGGKKSALKQSDVDRRKNMRQTARAVSIVVIVLLVGILGFGVKNALFPPESLQPEDVQQIIISTTGNTGFPTARGQAFAESFMTAYLSYSPTGGTENAALHYYLSGKISTDRVEYAGFNLSRDYSQSIVQGPYTSRTDPLGVDSALFTVGALVEIYDTSGSLTTDVPTPVQTPTPTPTPEPTDPAAEATDTDGEKLGTDGDTDEVDSAESAEATQEVTRTITTAPSNTSAGTKLMWQFFAVNVYYDAETDSFAIAGIPALVPTPATVPAADLPKDSLPGNGDPMDAETMAKLRPTINGFLEAYRVSSPTNFEKLIPFLPDEPTNALLQGLNSEFAFKSGAADDQSISVKGYLTNNPTEWRVAIRVSWTQTLGNAKAEYFSDYIMSIEQVPGGFDVTRFIPSVYTPES